jgi:hypothetical protein
VPEHMDGAAARGELARLLLEAAAAQAVADAEAVVCTAWGHHLNDLVNSTRYEVDAARAACDAARDLLRATRDSEDPGVLRTVRTVLECAEANQRQTLSEAHRVLTVVRDEIQVVAAAERGREAAARRNALRFAALRNGPDSSEA